MSNLTLGELIAALEAEDSAKVCPVGFGKPHTDRGDYMDLAFDPASDVTIGSMLDHARSALGQTFQGYKGGDYTMDEWTYVLIGEWGDLGENIGSTLLRLMLNAAVVPSGASSECAVPQARPSFRDRVFREIEGATPDRTYDDITDAVLQVFLDRLEELRGEDKQEARIRELESGLRVIAVATSDPRAQRKAESLLRPGASSE